jgi:hypothetical protein
MTPMDLVTVIFNIDGAMSVIPSTRRSITLNC